MHSAAFVRLGGRSRSACPSGALAAEVPDVQQRFCGAAASLATGASRPASPVHTTSARSTSAASAESLRLSFRMSATTPMVMMSASSGVRAPKMSQHLVRLEPCGHSCRLECFAEQAQFRINNRMLRHDPKRKQFTIGCFVPAVVHSLGSAHAELQAPSLTIGSKPLPPRKLSKFTKGASSAHSWGGDAILGVPLPRRRRRP